jgi:hypothetical protein
MKSKGQRQDIRIHEYQRLFIAEEVETCLCVLAIRERQGPEPDGGIDFTKDTAHLSFL